MPESQIAPDLLTRALSVYELETSMGGPDKEALARAISAALLQHERVVIDRMAKILDTFADTTLAAEEGDDDEDDERDREAQAFGMKWAASRLRKEIPEVAGENGLYIPRDGDIVEIVLGGQVHIAEESCEKCGHQSQSLWSIYDSRTSAEYYFDEAELRGRLNVRLLYRMEE